MQFGELTVFLSIKLALHRSLQGELLAIIEKTVCEDQPSTPGEVLAEVRRLGLETRREAASIVRADRDRR